MIARSTLVPLALLTAAALALPASAADIAWEEALRRAEQTGDGIVVNVDAAWHHGCNVFETETLDDPRVRSALYDGWILVRVDVDRRPDLHRLFHARGHDGLPTVHFLDSSGRELTRAGAIDAGKMAETLDQLRAGRRPGMSLLAEGAIVAPVPRTPLELLETARAEFVRGLEPELVGPGTGPRSLVAVETDFLIELARSDPGTFGPELAHLVTAVLDSPLHDTVDGGFHGASQTADWYIPTWEKRLEAQAVMLEALTLDAALFPAHRDRNFAAVEGTIAFLSRRLADARTELFFASVNADVLSSGYGGIVETGAEYYARSARSRVGAAPPVDETLLAASNARAAAALIEAGRAWKKRVWIKMGQRVRRAIPRELVDEEKRLLRWMAGEAYGPALVEDWTEWGFLLLTTGDPGDRERASDVVRTIRRQFVGETGRLLSRPVGAPRLGESADVGGDGARTVLFLSRYALEVGDGETTFLAMDLLDALAASRPAPPPAALGLAAHPLARE